jgi:hypothetical protein
VEKHERTLRAAQRVEAAVFESYVAGRMAERLQASVRLVGTQWREALAKAQGQADAAARIGRRR